MMHGDKKKAVGIILSRMNPEGKMAEGGVVKNEAGIDPQDAALHAHASDMMSAIHNKSPGDLVRAMKNFMEEHQLHEDKDDETPSDYSPEEK